MKRKLKILMINPPYSRLLGFGQALFPLCFGNMATMLSQADQDVAIYDANYDKNLSPDTYTNEDSFLSQPKIATALADDKNKIWKEIEQTIKIFMPNVIGITVMSNIYPIAVKIARIAKVINRDIKIVFGGHHPSIYGTSVLQNNDIDFAVIGEGEITFCELMDAMANNCSDYSFIKGLAYKLSGNTVCNAPRDLIKNLDDLPIADRNLIINNNYKSENNVITSRGCPFNCSYCGSHALWGRKVRKRSVQNVVKEISYLFQQSSSRKISFWDDSFTCDPQYINELINELKKFENINFSCLTRLDLIDEGILIKLKEAGCDNIMFGIESGNDAILKLMNKKINCELIRKKIKIVNAVGIPWSGFFMMGYPGENKYSIIDTLNFMKELNPSFAHINIFNPLPGSSVWNELLDKKLVSVDMDFAKHSQASTDNIYTQDSISKEDFKILSLYIAREFDKHNIRGKMKLIVRIIIGRNLYILMRRWIKSIINIFAIILLFK